MSDSSLEELKSHPKVLDLYLSRLRLKKESSTRYRGTCPFHSENTPSFDVFQHQNRWIHKCLGCGAAGSVLDLVQKTDNVDFKEAVRITREFCSEWASAKPQVESVFKSVGENETKKFRTFSEQEYAKLEQSLANNKAAQTWLLESRGISLETAKRLRLGYRQDVGKLCGDSNSEVANKGWIAFPTFDRGNITSIKYRSLAAKIFCKQPGMKTELFNLSDIDFLEPVFLVEGEFDAAALSQSGFRSVSLPNAQYNPTPSDKDLLLQAECVILAGDNDGAAGTKLMQRLWSEMQERTFLLSWPTGIKDANAFWDKCGREISVFRTKINELVNEAKAKPMQGVYDIRQSLLHHEHTNLISHPDRLRMPWKSVEEMAIILPGTVTVIYSTDSGMGKSTMAIQASIYAAKHGEVVLNYQAEMSSHQLDTIFTSHLLRKDRRTLGSEDYKAAGRLLGDDFKYYIGRDTSLTTITEVLDLVEKGIRRFGATVTILDNLHFLCRNESDPIKAQANAMQRITNLTARYGQKFILIHQARKADQNHKRKVTHVSDLDGSKAVQNDASTILSIHREEIKFDKNDEAEAGTSEYDPITEIRLQKARDKGEGKAYAKLMFLGEYCTFSEIIPDSFEFSAPEPHYQTA